MDATAEQGLFTATTDPLSGRTRFTPPHNGTPTSKAAARAMKGAVVEQQYRSILIALAAPAWKDGLTRQELEEVTGLRGDSIRPRVLELIDYGKVYEQGTRKTRAGKDAVVLHIAKGGAE